MVEAALALFLFAAFALWLAKSGSPRRRARRGRRLVGVAEARFRARNNAGGVTWGGLPLPEGAETSHFLVAGTTGSGKSLTLGRLMGEALEGASVGSDVRALIYDPKTELVGEVAALARDLPVVILHPFDRRGAAWDIAADVTSPVAALQVAAALIPEEESGNRYFSDTARDLLTEVMVSFIAAGCAQWTLRDVILAMRSPERLSGLLRRTERGREVLEMHSGDPRAFGSVLSTARSRLAPFEAIAACWHRAERRVALRDWASGEMLLVLGNDDSARAAMDAVNRLLFQRASELALAASNSRTRRTWFFLDEVREAGKLPGLSRLMTKGRSRGVCVALGFQSVNGMVATYGREVAHEILGQCSQKALLRMEDESSAKWASATIGQHERVEVVRGESAGDGGRGSRSMSEQLQTADAVMPSEFLCIPPTSKARGLTGYYLSPHVGAWRRTLSLEQLLERQPRRAEVGVPEFVERPESDQYVVPWSGEDQRRLGLEQTAEQLREVEEGQQPRGLYRLDFDGWEVA